MSARLARTAFPRQRPLVRLIASVFALALPGSAFCMNFTVSNCAASGPGSLAAAAAQATHAGDVIDLSNIADVSACSSNIDGFAHVIVVPSKVTIAAGAVVRGPNTATTRSLAISANNNDRVLYSSGYLAVSDIGIIYGNTTTTLNGRPSVYGGCIYAIRGAYLNNVVLQHCAASTTAANISTKGGAIAASAPGAAIVLKNSTISNSSAMSGTSGNSYGGAIYAYGNVTLVGSTVSGYAGAAAGNAKGGGIAIDGSTYAVTLTSSGVVQSTASSDGDSGSAQGGGVFSSGLVRMYQSSRVLSNTATQQSPHGTGGAAGGNIFAVAGVLQKTGAQIYSGTAKTASAATARGGGIYSQSYTHLESAAVSGNQVTSTSGSVYGAGIFSVGAVTTKYSSLRSNSALGAISSGGAVLGQGGVTMRNGTVAFNFARQGGGIAMPGGSLYLGAVAVFNNSGRNFASGIDAYSGGTSDATIVNSTISGNRTSSTQGYGVFIDAATTSISNSTIAYNIGLDMAGVRLTGPAGATVGLYSTLISGNITADATPMDFSIGPNVRFTSNSSHNLIRTPTSSVPAGTLTGPASCPFLYPLANGTHRPGRMSASAAARSPAIDAGSNPLNLASDQRGGVLGATSPARVSGAAADIGAYEVQQDDVIFDDEFDTCR